MQILDRHNEASSIPHRTTQKMELTVQAFGTQHVVELDEDATVESFRLKVASAVGLAEDSFESFGDDVRALCAGDTIVLVETSKHRAVAALRAMGETNVTKRRLAEIRDPEVACLFLHAGVSETPHEFLSNSTTLTVLDLSAVSHLTEIGGCFLANCTTLKTIELSGLRNVEKIGREFLSGCSALTEVDLSGLGKVNTTEFGFLQMCSSLESVNLCGLGGLSRVGVGFLAPR